MDARKRSRKILLAVDASSDDETSLRALARAVRAESGGSKAGTRLEPVYVIRPDSLALAEMMLENFASYERAVRAKVEKRLRRAGLRGLPPATVLLAPAVPGAAEAKTLVRYAKQSGADLIALTTHSRKGMRRLFLGSFAETLMARSDVPLLVVNPRERWRRNRVRTIFFPTDLSPESRRGLELIADRLEHRGREGTTRIIVFHHMKLEPSWYMEPYLNPPIPQRVWQEELERRTRTAEAWIAELERRGIEAELEIRRKDAPVRDEILKAARGAKADQIAIVSRSGPVEGWFLGSTARAVVRGASCPVWVVHVPPGAVAQKAVA